MTYKNWLVMILITFALIAGVSLLAVLSLRGGVENSELNGSDDNNVVNEIQTLDLNDPNDYTELANQIVGEFLSGASIEETREALLNLRVAREYQSDHVDLVLLFVDLSDRDVIEMRLSDLQARLDWLNLN